MRPSFYYKPMRKKILSQAIKKATLGACNTLLDILLLEARILGRISLGERATMTNIQRIIDEEVGIIPKGSISQALAHARRNKLISRGGVLTKKGTRRLEKIFPLSQPTFRWNKTWIFVIFDIPEQHRTKRNVLRAYLQKWKFGKLQNSVWVSVHDASQELIELCRLYRIEQPQLLFWKTKNIGMDPKKAASYIWDLKKLNQRYKKYIEEYSTDGSRFQGIVAFRAIAQDDPQLPQELLPTPWNGWEAFRIYQTLQKRMK